MTTPIESDLGKIHISDLVIATVAGIAATECYGLVGMASRNVGDGLTELLGREHFDRGVEVQLDQENVTINLYVVVEYGVNIAEVARNVMERVKHSVESLLGLSVVRVNVHVQGVRVGTPARKGRK